MSFLSSRFIQRQDNLSKEMEAVLLQIREKELLIAKSTVSDTVLSEMKSKFDVSRGCCLAV